MRNLTIFFCVLIILVPSSYAETKIYSGVVITDTDKVIDEKIFRFSYEPNSKKVFVQTPATDLIVDNGACKSGAIFRVCINRANFSYKNITTYVYHYELDVTVYKSTVNLSTSRKAASNVLLQHEPTVLTINIQNPTDFEITNLVYKEDLTPFEVKEIKGCSLEGSKIVWYGSLDGRRNKTCTATISSGNEGTFNLEGYLSYFDISESETTDFLTITVLPKQLKLSQIIDKNIKVKQPFYVNISLENINKVEDIEASVTTKLPSNLVLVKDAEGHELTFLKYNSIIKPNAKMNYTLYLEALSEGNNIIKQKIEYSIKGTKDAIENIILINITQLNQTIAKEIIAEKPEPSNGTAFETPTTSKKKEYPFINKEVFLSITIIVAAIMVIIFIASIVQRKKGYDSELPEDDALSESTEENQKIFKPNN